MSNLADVWSRWRRRLRELGPARFAFLILDRAVDKLSAGRLRLVAYEFMAQPLDLAAAPPVSESQATRIVQLGRDDALLAQMPRDPRVAAARFDGGAECTAAVVNGELAGTLWLARTTHHEDEVNCRYVLAEPAVSVWDFDVYVAPRYRGSRVFARMWRATVKRLAAEGLQWSFSRISVLNTASLASHRAMGARRVGRALFVAGKRWQLGLLTVAPYVHLGPRQGRPPTVTLAPPRTKPPMQTSSQAPLNSAPPPNPGARPRAPAALVLGLDSHGLAISRALADAGVVVYALERDPRTPGVRSNRVRRVFLTPDYTAPHLLPALLRARGELAQHDEVALLAVNDRQVTVIAENLPQVLPHYRVAWADRAPQILKLLRKSELETVSVQQGLQYPRSVLFDAPQAELAAGLAYPVILKPVRPLSSFKTLLLTRHEELGEALVRQAHDLPILGQEYIPGGDDVIYFGALMLDRGRVLHGMAGRKIASHPPARGQTTIAETVDAPDVMRLTEQFFAGMALSGPVSLELKRDPEGRFWVIEPTVGRTDFWVELCIGAGFNQPLMEYQLALGLPVSEAGPGRQCVWYDTERDPLAWLRLVNQERRLRPRGQEQCFPYFGHHDGRPLWRALRRTAWSWLQRRLRDT